MTPNTPNSNPNDIEKAVAAGVDKALRAAEARHRQRTGFTLLVGLLTVLVILALGAWWTWWLPRAADAQRRMDAAYTDALAAHDVAKQCRVALDNMHATSGDDATVWRNRALVDCKAAGLPIK